MYSTLQRRPSTAMLRACLPIVALMVMVVSASAQTSGQPQTPAAPPPAPLPNIELNQFAAQSIARVVYVDLRSQADPQADDFRIAEILLGLAQEYAPDDVELVRRRLEAAWSCKDKSLYDELTRRIVSLDANDTVALLRLIATRISNSQTAEARLDLYKRFLGPEGESIDPTIRSRLAMDAALLLRELGDPDAFVEYLSMATKLDSTNKAAAALAAAYVAEHVDDPVARLDMLANLLYADPVDPNIHLSIVSELFQAGAFQSAFRFHQNAINLHTVSGTPSSEDLIIQGLMLDWYNAGPAAVVDRLSTDLAVKRSEQERKLRSMLTNGMPVDDERPPSEIRLAAPYERVRIMAADAAGDRESVEVALADFEASAAELLQLLSNPETRPEEMSPDEAKYLGLDRAVELQVFRLWSNSQVDRAMNEFDELLARPEVADRYYDRIIGWAAARSRDLPRAMESWAQARSQDPEEALENLEGRDLTPGERLALAEIYLRLDRTADAINELRTVAREFPLTLVGVWAHTKANRLEGSDRPLWSHTEEMDSYAKSIPIWIDDMCRSGRSFQSLEVTPANLDPVAGQRIATRIKITNRSPIPLGIGPGRPINTRLLFAPDVRVSGRKFRGAVSPEVSEVGHRFRLLPRESFEIDLYPIDGETGWITDIYANRVSSLRWRVVQGFQTGRQLLEPGPLCLTTETPVIRVGAHPWAGLDADAIASKLQSVDESQFAHALVAARTSLLATRPDGSATSDAGKEAICRAAASRYAALSPVARAAMLAVFPNVRSCEQASIFDEAAASEDDPALVPLMLMTRVYESGTPMVEAGSQSEDLDVRRVASALRTRFGKSDPQGYSMKTGFEPPERESPTGGP